MTLKVILMLQIKICFKLLFSQKKAFSTKSNRKQLFKIIIIFYNITVLIYFWSKTAVFMYVKYFSQKHKKKKRYFKLLTTSVYFCLLWFVGSFTSLWNISILGENEGCQVALQLIATITLTNNIYLPTKQPHPRGAEKNGMFTIFISMSVFYKIMVEL